METSNPRNTRSELTQCAHLAQPSPLKSKILLKFLVCEQVILTETRVRRVDIGVFE